MQKAKKLWLVSIVLWLPLENEAKRHQKKYLPLLMLMYNYDLMMKTVRNL